MSELDRTMADLLAPPGPPVIEADRQAVRDLLVAGLTPLAGRLPAGGQALVSLPVLRHLGQAPDQGLRPDVPFAWKPAFVRRSLGLGVVQGCASGRFRTPAEAVAQVADEAVEEWRRTGWRTFHWEPWLAGLAPGARAVVLADAVTWATTLWSSLDWGALPEATQVGGVDDQWVCPAVRTVRLKARSELRVPLAPLVPEADPRRAPGAASALVAVAWGCPSPGWREELAYLALVAALRSATRPVPARVLGLWPDAGFREAVEVDRPVLERAVARVVATVGRLVKGQAVSAEGDGSELVAPTPSLAAA